MIYEQVVSAMKRLWSSHRGRKQQGLGGRQCSFVYRDRRGPRREETWVQMHESTEKWWRMKAASQPLNRCQEEEEDWVSLKREKTKTRGWNLYAINKKLAAASHSLDRLYCAEQREHSLPSLDLWFRGEVDMKHGSMAEMHIKSYGEVKSMVGVPRGFREWFVLI